MQRTEITGDNGTENEQSGKETGIMMEMSVGFETRREEQKKKTKRHGGGRWESDRNGGQTARRARALGRRGHLVTAGDWVDLSVGVDLKDALKGPPEGRDKGNIRLIGGAGAAVDVAEDAAAAVEDASARVALLGELGVALAVRDDSDFEGVDLADAVLGERTLSREQAVGVAEPSARGAAVHDDEQGGHAVGVEVGLARDLLGRYHAPHLHQAVNVLLVAGTVLDVGPHKVG